MVKEDLGGGIDCDTLLVGSYNGHLRESINNQKYIVISMLGGEET
jgi:hypothetical protein